MKRLGISIYPEHSTVEKDKAYSTLAHKYGFSRLFTCLLSVKGDKDEVIDEFKETIMYANELNMEVIVDIAPRVFNQLGISYDDLSFFHELEAELQQFAIPFSLTHDARIAHAALLEGKDGILTIAGTGAVSYGVCKGVLQMSGGWGHLLGDEGKGSVLTHIGWVKDAFVSWVKSSVEQVKFIDKELSATKGAYYLALQEIRNSCIVVDKEV